MATRQFADLSRYAAAAAQPTVSPLDALIQGVQQGVALRQLPQTIQQNALDQQLQAAIQQAKLQELQRNLQFGSVENVGGRLVRLNPQTGLPEVLLDVARTPANPQFAGFQGNVGLAFDPATRSFIQVKPPEGLDITGPLLPKTVGPETQQTVFSDQGIFKTGSRSTTATPLTIEGDQLTKTKPAPAANVRQITDANGFLFTQPMTGGALTPVLNEDGTPFNAGIPNRVFTSDQGVFSVPTKAAGAPTPTPLTAPTTTEGAPGTQLTKTTKSKDSGVTEGSKVFLRETNKAIIDSVDNLLPRTDNTTVGLGSLTSGIPTTPAADYESDLEQLKAAIKTSKLIEIKNSSKTGGAFGNLSDKEGKTLESLLGALDRKQSPANMKKNLTKIKESIQRYDAGVEKYGGGIETPESIGSLLKSGQIDQQEALKRFRAIKGK